MSAATIKDSGDALPMGEADHRMDGTLGITGGEGATPPRARTKRQRPTFDDGSITRTFKFPSKVYPRSSYYVTSTEIIIRIKKARKKWKLVVPKKRVVAYRTNRWFAKPRWIEIELTYTQASRLGLVESRKPSKEVTSDTSAEHETIGLPVVENVRDLPDDPPSASERNGISTGDTFFQLDPSADQSERAINEDAFDCPSDSDDLQDDAVLPASLPHGGSCSPALLNSQKAARRANAFRLIMALTAVSATVAAAWMTLTDVPSAPMIAGTACTRSEQSAFCRETLVTGSIDKDSQGRWPEPDTPKASEVPASPARVFVIEQPELSAPQSSPLADVEGASGRAGDPTDVGRDRVDSKESAVERDPLPAATVAENSPLPPPTTRVDRDDCRELRATGQAINIQFGYASSSLDKTVLPVLEAFAMRLRSCPAAKLVIEGHTDSDGRARHNRALSVHRAKVVLEHLVHAGVKPDRLSAVGFGQTRPYAPNITTENKRSNRRAALVVEH